MMNNCMVNNISQAAVKEKFVLGICEQMKMWGYIAMYIVS